MSDGDRLKDLLPEPLKERVRSILVKDGVATAMMDAAGLDAEQRAAIEREAKRVLEADAAIAEARIALIADKVKRRIIAVGSGKGGVGKSTLAANLAIALARSGADVGMVDADIYGPSQPTLLDNEDAKPQARDGKLIPVGSPHGVRVLSMGHLAKPGKAIAWRGPMAGNALSQLIDAHWGDTHILIVDLPPGTGDVQLSMLQRFRPDGAVIVSTPQDLALIDAARAADLFGQGEVPLIGLVENMAGYVCPHCGETSDPFGQGGAEQAAARMDIPFLGRIPLSIAIRTASDAGVPPAAGSAPEAQPFADIAARVSDWLSDQAG
jgi:ATP-binding protein involved in chromosome partitioning